MRRLIVWCRGRADQVEPNPVEPVERQGADTPVLDWRERILAIQSRTAATRYCLSLKSLCDRIWPILIGAVSAAHTTKLDEEPSHDGEHDQVHDSREITGILPVPSRSKKIDQVHASRGSACVVPSRSEKIVNGKDNLKRCWYPIGKD